MLILNLESVGSIVMTFFLSQFSLNLESFQNVTLVQNQFHNPLLTLLGDFICFCLHSCCMPNLNQSEQF